MNYSDLGYNSYLLRPLEATYIEQVGIDSSVVYEQISGSQVRGDKISSLNRTLNLDLEHDSFILTDGSTNRIEFGKLPSGEIGLIIRDDKGNILLEISGATNKIQSSNGHVNLDFNEERLLIKDEGGTPVVLIGKGDF